MTVHACFFCLDDFRRRNEGRLPTPGSDRDAKAFLSLVQSSPFFSSPKSSSLTSVEGVGVDERVVMAFARTCAGGLSPLAGFYGGVVAQEVLKGWVLLVVTVEGGGGGVLDFFLFFSLAAGREHIGFSPARQALLAPSAKRREVFGESREGCAASVKVS